MQLMHVCVWEHIVSIYYRTACWMFQNLVGMMCLWPAHALRCFRQIGPGQIQGRVKLGHRGSPSSRNFFDRKATATNLMHSNDLEACGMKCCYFWFPSEVKFLTRFDVFLDLVILPYSNAISIGFLCGKVLHLHLFCVISMFLCGRRLKNLNELFMYLHCI